MHGLPTADNNSIGESKDCRKTPAFFEVLCLVYMSNSCSSKVAVNLRNTTRKERALEAVKTQTLALFSSSCHRVLCSLYALHHFVAQGLDFHASLHHYTCMHRSNWDSD